MVSVNKNILFSLHKFILNKKILCFILIFFCINILILTGCCEILKLSDCCPWDLYEVHVDERKFASEWEKIKNDKNIKDEDKDKIENLIEVINKRSNPKIGLYQYEKGDRLRYDLYEKGDRYIRYDLENFIMGEWKKG